MSGAPDPIYVAARATLLDALQALEEHRTSIILVGAQAVYRHTGEADVAVAAVDLLVPESLGGGGTRGPRPFWEVWASA